MIKKLILGMMQTNCYVVYNSEKECIVIDPGANGQKVAKFIDENELFLKAILLTHGHFDHVGAVDYLYSKWEIDKIEDLDVMLRSFEEKLGHKLSNQIESYVINRFIKDKNVDVK